MSEAEHPLDAELVEAFGKLVELDPDDDRFEAFAKLVHSYHGEVESLHGEALDYAVPPALYYQLVPPSDPDGGIHFSFSDSHNAPPDSDDALAFQPVSTLANLIASKQISPVELTTLYLDRLEQYADPLHCVVTLTAELALEQARKAENEITKGELRGPLHGIPWGAKDLLATAGIPTTWGATPYRDQVFAHDAAVVERLREAGAVLVAKLSMGALAMGPHWFGGMTRNPWDPESGSSGSSAGSGASTAAGLVGFSIGTETHGSITSPSHTCGVTGLRPTFGRVSRHGAMALGYSLDKIGPMCRSVEDCAAVFSAIAGRDERDGATVDAAFRWPVDRDVKGLRVGFVAAEYDLVEEDDVAVYRDALDVLRDLGCHIQPVELPDCPKGLMMTVWVEAAAAFGELIRTDALDALTTNDNSNWPNVFRAAQTIPAPAYVRAQRLRTKLVSDFESLMQDWDVLVVPGPGKTSMTVGNLTGYPALTLPCGFTDGKPRGMTLIGQLYDEAGLLAAGLAYERATDWHSQHPDLSGLE